MGMAVGQRLASPAVLERPALRRLVAAVVVVTVAAPFVAAIVRYWGIDWYPMGDRALIEMQVHGLFDPAHTPLLGAYSRYGWSHPGPLVYWILAVPYHLLGRHSSALLVSTVALNAAATFTFLFALWRRGGFTLLLCGGAVVSLLLRSLGADFLADPWNPFVTVLPLLAFLGVAWSAREGERWALPANAFLATFLVQSHVAYLVIVVGVTVWAALPLLGRVGRRVFRADHPSVGQPRWAQFDRRHQHALLASALIVGVFWLPVLYDQISGRGNLADIARHFTRSASEPPAGFWEGAGVVARELGPDAAWYGTKEPYSVTGGVVPRGWFDALLVLFALAVISVGVRRRDGNTNERTQGKAEHLLSLALVVLLAGWISVARINGVVFDYLIRWWWAAAAFISLAALYGIVHIVRTEPNLARFRRALGVGGVAMLLLVCITSSRISVTNTSRAGVPVPDEVGADGPFFASLLANTPAGDPVFVRGAGGGRGHAIDGVRLQLTKGGRLVVLAPNDAWKFGRGRTGGGDPAAWTLWVVQGYEIEGWRTRKDLVEVAAWDPLIPTDREEATTRTRQLAYELDEAGRGDIAHALMLGDGIGAVAEVEGIDHANLRRVDQLRYPGRPIAVFVEPFDPAHLT